jgi:uncharacterized protein (DUF2249 family)
MKRNKRITLTCLIILISAIVSAQNYASAFKIGAAQHDEAYGIYEDSEGNFYMSGNFEGTVDFDPGSGEALMTATSNYDGFLVKYDADWNYLWAISISGSGYTYCRHIEVDDDLNIYVTGYFSGEADFDPGSEEYLLEGVELDGFLAKYNQDGDFVWAFDIGSEFNCTAFDVALDISNDIWVSGVFKGEVDFDPSENEFLLSGHGFQDAYMAKYTDAGEFIWAGEIGGDLSTLYLPTLQCDSEGNLYFSSYFNETIDLDPGQGMDTVTSNGSSDILLVKLNSSGAFEWGFAMGGNLQDQSRDIIIDNSRIYISGLFEDSIDFDPSSGQAVFTSTEDYDAYVAAYTLDGEYLWAIAMAGNNFNCPAQGMALSADDDHNIYVGGAFYGTVDFDPSAITFELTSQGDWDFFVSKYDQAGNFIWALNGGGNENDYAYNILVRENQEEVMVCGKFKGYAEFDHIGPGHLLSAAGGFDAFLASYYTYDGASVDEWESRFKNIPVYPNPADSYLNIDFPPGKRGNYLIYNLVGDEILSGDLNGGKNVIFLDNLAGGVYFIKLIMDRQSFVQKILLE